MALLELTHIKTQYNASDFTLEVPELLIEQGEFFGIIGESGCGKTTLLKAIGGLNSLNQGTIKLDGKDITHTKAELRNMSMVFQEPLLFPHMTVIDNICFPLKVRGINKSKRYTRAQTLLKQVGLTGFDKRSPAQLSGGQQQRVSIARALIHEPDIVLMDEPFSALDPELRDEMRRLIKRLQSELKITVIFVTHQLDEAAILFDRVAVISDGKIIQTGKPSDIYNAPASIDVAKFFGFKNIFKREREMTTSDIPSDVLSDNSSINTPFIVKDSGLNLGPAPEYAACVLIPNHAINRNKNGHEALQVQGLVLEKNFVHGLIHFHMNVSGVQLHYFESMSGDISPRIGDSLELFIQTELLLFFR